MREIAVHLFLELRVDLCFGVGPSQFQDQRHQRLGDKAAAIDAEMPAVVRPGAEGIRSLDRHHRNSLTWAAFIAFPPARSYPPPPRPGRRLAGGWRVGLRRGAPCPALTASSGRASWR